MLKVLNNNKSEGCATNLFKKTDYLAHMFEVIKIYAQTDIQIKKKKKNIKDIHLLRHFGLMVFGWS